MFWLLLACAPTIPDCDPGQHIDASNQCVDDPEIPGADVLPACEPLAADDRVDIEAGCADGACAESTYDAINQALGETGVCRDTIEGLTFCGWLDGTLETFFEDDDGDAVPDAGALGSGIFLDPGYDGASEDGLGLGVSLACFIDVYGYTDEVEYEDEAIRELWWTGLGLFVHDDDYDGVTDEISLFGR